MKVLIKTEGGTGIGYGHIMRCFSLAQAFKEKGIEPQMWVKGNPDLKDLSKEVQMKLDSLDPSSDFWNQLGEADVAVIDSYLDTDQDYKKVSQSVKVPVYLDDTHRLKYPRGVVLNGSVGVKTDGYSIDTLVGSEYILIRREFWDVEPSEIQPEMKTVLVTFGGEDPREMSQPVLKLLTREFPELNKIVIIGSGFKKVDELKATADDKTEFVISPDAKAMIQAMKKSDVAISAGGQTLNELSRLAVPTVIVKVADNQEETAGGWAHSGFALLAGEWNSPQIYESLQKSLHQLNSFETRKKMADIGRQISDGQGARRVVEALQESVRKS